VFALFCLPPAFPDFDTQKNFVLCPFLPMPQMLGTQHMRPVLTTQEIVYCVSALCIIEQDLFNHQCVDVAKEFALFRAQCLA
jgi:hypothetical protein